MPTKRIEIRGNALYVEVSYDGNYIGLRVRSFDDDASVTLIASEAAEIARILSAAAVLEAM